MYFIRRVGILLDWAAFGGLLLLAFALALESYQPVLIIYRLAFTNIETMQLVVIILWLASRLLRIRGMLRDPRQWQVGPVPITAGLWLTVALATTIFAPAHQQEAMIFDSRLIRGALIAWAAFDLTRTRTRWLAVIYSFAAGGIIVYALGLAEAANFAPIVAELSAMRGTATYVGDLLRIESSLPYPTIAAMIIELTLPCVLIGLVTARHTWMRLCLGIGLIGGLMALMLTFTRGGLMATAASLILMVGLALYIHPSAHRLRWIIGSCAAIGGVLLVLLGFAIAVNPSAALRFVSENNQNWYQAIYETADAIGARPGETLTIPIKLTNTGFHTWQVSGDHPFRLSYHLIYEYPYARRGVSYEGQRSLLPTDVPPGAMLTVMAVVAAPPAIGDYFIQWDMVQEGVTWFSVQHSPMGRTRLSVAGEPVANPAPFDETTFDDVTPPTSPGRLQLWTIALQMVHDRPLLGVGPDNFRWEYGTYAGVTEWDRNTHANNLYFEWLADMGIFGLLAFLWFSLQVARAAWRGLKRHTRDSQFWLWQLALMGALCAWYVHGLVDYFYEFTPTYTAFWLLVGLSVVLQTEPA